MPRKKVEIKITHNGKWFLVSVKQGSLAETFPFENEADLKKAIRNTKLDSMFGVRKKLKKVM